tara:strand:- start:138 stop:605 length:468 start_codon:yes stop_codon:yes gene_type:complete
MNKEILSKEFESLKTDLIIAYDAKGMRASGNWAEQLEVFTEENRAIIFGEDYSEQLDKGRAAGKRPPVKDIEDWIYAKGLDARIQNEISVSSLAFLIARKIGREGYDRQGYGGVDLISEIVTEQRLQKIINEVGEAKLIEFTSEIFDLFRQLEMA